MIDGVIDLDDVSIEIAVASLEVMTRWRLDYSAHAVVDPDFPSLRVYVLAEALLKRKSPIEILPLTDCEITRRWLIEKI